MHLDDLGVRPLQDRIPLLVGGHGRRVVELGGIHADIFQFTGLIHGEGGVPSGGGFALDDIAERARRLTRSAAGRDVERSALVQLTHVGPPRPAELAERFGLSADVIEHSPFVLVGSVTHVVERLERLRDRIGLSHVVVRDPDGFAPVVDALAGR